MTRPAIDDGAAPSPAGAGRRLFALLVLGFVAWATLTPRPPSAEGLPEHSDLVAHVALFAALGLAQLRAWPRTAAVGAALALALALEAAQAAIPGRTFAFADMAANLFGAAAAAGAYALIPRLR